MKILRIESLVYGVDDLDASIRYYEDWGLALERRGTHGADFVLPSGQTICLRANGDRTWAAVVRFQNYSYDTGMHVYAIDAELSLNGKPAGHVAISPALDIPAMDADIATAVFKPDPAGSAVLAGAKGNAVAYELKGTLSVGKGTNGSAQPFKLDGKGYLSPVPGVSNVWR